ncbi:hypothetical protein CEUSTIGMA_g728.t1 [Chlamydomonas eustigma]|uniref:Thiaminase-2/PQQC domain-containing protein n=1 Tax=Chlamydomonas eustigma TaxID=1157962 RepID=A0A250WQY7_9CHLO|nr:hypothetical protein CEUSTIGMA_g728.t1 [Chlamydomonas eustigma]|eukprot:GAX73274.1 hypothetical protein CEUSTIGMA_g728.t1 [Chlamydomonas eustigma]
MSDEPDVPDGLPLQGGLSWRLWRDSEEVAMKSLHHSFVTSMADGSLPRSSYEHYLTQDVFYLEHFAKAYELVLPKCKSHGQEVQKAIESLLEGARKEIEHHKSSAATLGVFLVELKPVPATLAYTSFLIDVAQGPLGLDAMLAAMAPCARLYGYLGCQLARRWPESKTGPYADWVNTYSAPKYLALPDVMEKLLDGMEGITDYETLKDLYFRAMQLEFEFFDAQPK